MRNSKGRVFIVLALCLTLCACKAIKSKGEFELVPSHETPSITKNVPHESRTGDSYVQKRFDTRNSKISETNQATLASTATSSKRLEKRGGSVIGEMIFGFILFFSGFPCLWFNEKGYAYTKTFLRKYVKECIPVRSEEIDPNNANKLICAQGTTTTTENIDDPDFGIQINSSIKLNRVCEGLQWQEHRSSTRVSSNYDEVTYSYKLNWSNSFIESRNFAEGGHDNFSQDWLFESKKTNATLVTYGAFKLTESQKDQCCKQEPVPIPQETANLIAQKGGFNLGQPNSFVVNNPSAPPPPPPGSDSINNPLSDNNTNDSSHALLNQNAKDSSSINQDSNNNFISNQGVVQTSQGANQSNNFNGNIFGAKTVTIQGNYLYFRKDQLRESPGDFRVSFNRTPCGAITVIGSQSVDCIDTFIPEQEGEKVPNLDSIELQDSGCCACCSIICKACEAINAPISEINWVKEETATKQQIFQEQLSMYELKTWLMRLAGFCCFMFGVYFILSPVYTFLYWFPLVGRFLGSLGEFICGLVGFLIAIPLTILTISIAWLFYRKEIGIPLLLAALIVIGYFTYSYAKDYKGEQEVPAF